MFIIFDAFFFCLFVFLWRNINLFQQGRWYHIQKVTCSRWERDYVDRAFLQKSDRPCVRILGWRDDSLTFYTTYLLSSFFLLLFFFILSLLLLAIYFHVLFFFSSLLDNQFLYIHQGWVASEIWLPVSISVCPCFELQKIIIKECLRLYLDLCSYGEHF